jgi:hypothetical protein
MKTGRLSRRGLLKGSGALALGAVFASPARAEAPPPVAITPQLIDAAKNEARVILYSSMDLPVGEKLGKAFETAYPGISVQIERAGSERLFQRLARHCAADTSTRGRLSLSARLAGAFVPKTSRNICGVPIPTSLHATTRSGVVDRLNSIS